MVAIAVSLMAASTAVTSVVAPASAAPRARILGIAMAPGTAGLTPQLTATYTWAYRDAQRGGVPMYVNSGKRSWATQHSMWRQGVREYGSAARAQRWVLPPNRSTHVSGEAVDVGPRAGAAWLQRNGWRYGLCRTFDNEWWHFELVTLPGTPCPPRLPDASRR